MTSETAAEYFERRLRTICLIVLMFSGRTVDASTNTNSNETLTGDASTNTNSNETLTTVSIGQIPASTTSAMATDSTTTTTTTTTSTTTTMTRTTTATTTTPAPLPFVCKMTVVTPTCNANIVKPGCSVVVPLPQCRLTLKTPACSAAYVPTGAGILVLLDRCNYTKPAPPCNRTLTVPRCPLPFVCNMTLITPSCTLNFKNPGCNKRLHFTCGVNVRTPACSGEYVTPNWNIFVDIIKCNYSIPAPPCNGSALINPCPTPPPPFVCNLTLWTPQYNFTIEMPPCGSTVDLSNVYNTTVLALRCYTEYVTPGYNLTVVIYGCNYSLATPPCNGTLLVPECKPPPVPKPVFYMSSRNAFYFVGDSISIVCKWRHDQLFNHTWHEMVQNRLNGTLVAVNTTSLYPTLYSAYGEVQTANDVDMTGVATETTIVVYTLDIISAKLADAGRYQCANDYLDPTDTGCLDIFITESKPTCTDNVTGIAVDQEPMLVSCSIRYLGAYAPVLALYHRSRVNILKTINDTVFAMATYAVVVRVKIPMNGVTYPGKLYFPSMPDIHFRKRQNCDYRAPSSELMFTVGKVVVNYGPRNLRWTPNKHTYDIGNTITVTTDANPNARYNWKNDKTGEIISTFESLMVSSEMIGVNNFTIHAYNIIGRNSRKAELVFTFVLRVNEIYKGPINPKKGNLKAMILAGTVSGVMCGFLTLWVAVLLISYNKAAATRRVERVYNRHMEKLWHEEERRRHTRHNIKKDLRRKAAMKKPPPTLFSYFFGEEKTDAAAAGDSSNISDVSSVSSDSDGINGITVGGTVAGTGRGGHRGTAGAPKRKKKRKSAPAGGLLNLFGAAPNDDRRHRRRKKKQKSTQYGGFFGFFVNVVDDTGTNKRRNTLG